MDQPFNLSHGSPTPSTNDFIDLIKIRHHEQQRHALEDDDEQQHDENDSSSTHNNEIKTDDIVPSYDFQPIRSLPDSSPNFGSSFAKTWNSDSNSKVSKLGNGSLGLTGFYNDVISDDVAISLIKHCFTKGITFFDTSDVYGPRINKVLVGKELKDLPRDRIQIATKFGVVNLESSNVVVNGSP